MINYEKLNFVTTGYNYYNNTSKITLNTSSILTFDSNPQEYFKNTKDKIKTTSTLQEGDRVYFTTFSDIPRYKFRDYCKDKDISRVIKIDKCNKLVGDFDKFLKTSYIINRNYYKVNKSDIEVELVNPLSYSSLPENFVVSGEDINRFNNLSKCFKKGTFDDKNYVNKFTLVTYTGPEVNEVVKQIEDFNNLLSTQIPIISDKDMSSIINNGSVIDDDMYKELIKMFESPDNQTVALAMDILANTNYKESEFKILLLLNRFYTTKIHSNPSKNLVNFKALLKYFEKYNYARGGLYLVEDIMKNSFKEDNDYDEKWKYCINFVLDYVNDTCLKHTGYQVKEVTYNKKALD